MHSKITQLRLSYAEFLQYIEEEILLDKEIPDADVFLAAEFISGLTRTELITSEKILLDKRLLRIAEEVRRQRSTHTPLPYIIGKTSFYGNEFIVSPAVLIPRPETEQLVDISIFLAKTLCSELGREINVFEVGVGSGCIAASVWDNASKNIANYNAIDVSLAAVKLARKNIAKILPDNGGGKLSFEGLNISVTDFRHMPKKASLQFLDSDLIISNPPYIDSTIVLKSLPDAVAKHEPHIALDGGKYGMDFYNLIAKQLESSSKNKLVALEVGEDNADKVAELFIQLDMQAEVLLDLFGRKRFVVASSFPGIELRSLLNQNPAAPR